MATYLAGMTGKAAFLPWQPNVNMYAYTLQNLNTTYEASVQAIDQQLGSFMLADITNEENAKARNAYYEGFQNYVSRIRNIDLTDPSHFDAIRNSLKPFYSDSYLTRDIAYTKIMKNSESVYEMDKNTQLYPSEENQFRIANRHSYETLQNYKMLIAKSDRRILDYFSPNDFKYTPGVDIDGYVISKIKQIDPEVVVEDVHHEHEKPTVFDYKDASGEPQTTLIGHSLTYTKKITRGIYSDAQLNEMIQKDIANDSSINEYMFSIEKNSMLAYSINRTLSDLQYDGKKTLNSEEVLKTLSKYNGEYVKLLNQNMLKKNEIYTKELESRKKSLEEYKKKNKINDQSEVGKNINSSINSYQKAIEGLIEQQKSLKDIIDKQNQMFSSGVILGPNGYDSYLQLATKHSLMTYASSLAHNWNDLHTKIEIQGLKVDDYERGGGGKKGGSGRSTKDDSIITQSGNSSSDSPTAVGTTEIEQDMLEEKDYEVHEIKKQEQIVPEDIVKKDAENQEASKNYYLAGSSLAQTYDAYENLYKTVKNIVVEYGKNNRDYANAYKFLESLSKDKKFENGPLVKMFNRAVNESKRQPVEEEGVFLLGLELDTETLRKEMNSFNGVLENHYNRKDATESPSDNILNKLLSDVSSFYALSSYSNKVYFTNELTEFGVIENKASLSSLLNKVHILKEHKEFKNFNNDFKEQYFGKNNSPEISDTYTAAAIAIKFYDMDNKIMINEFVKKDEKYFYVSGENSLVANFYRNSEYVLNKGGGIVVNPNVLTTNIKQTVSNTSGKVLNNVLLDRDMLLILTRNNPEMIKDVMRNIASSISDDEKDTEIIADKLKEAFSNKEYNSSILAINLMKDKIKYKEENKSKEGFSYKITMFSRAQDTIVSEASMSGTKENKKSHHDITFNDGYTFTYDTGKKEIPEIKDLKNINEAINKKDEESILYTQSIVGLMNRQYSFDLSNKLRKAKTGFNVDNSKSVIFHTGISAYHGDKDYVYRGVFKQKDTLEGNGPITYFYINESGLQSEKQINLYVDSDNNALKENINDFEKLEELIQKTRYYSKANMEAIRDAKMKIAKANIAEENKKSKEKTQ